MTSLTEIDLSDGFSSGSPAAEDKVDAGQLDSDHVALREWINDQFLPFLNAIFRDDDTLVDSFVRLRNLHPEITAIMGSAEGWQPKAKVACASTANLTLSGEQTIDGVLTSASRVLVKDQTAGAENGIYVTAAGAWTRSTDADTSTEIGYAAVYVDAGSVNLGSAFVLTAAASAITLGTTSLTWAKFYGPTIVHQQLLGTDVLQQVDTIAALKALTTHPDTVFVRGYTSINDGGGGNFRWSAFDATADNGGTVIAPTVGSGRWNRVYSDRMTPEWFGAVGDASTDDYVAVNAAITQANADGGGEVWLHKRYRIRGGAVVLKSNVRLSGPGTLYLDFAANTNKGVYALGTASGLKTLTVNTANGGYTVTVAAGDAAAAGIVAGSMVILNSNYLGGKYPEEALEVLSVSAGGGSGGGDLITLVSGVNAAFNTADTSKIKRISPVSNITIDGITIECSSTSDIDYVLRFDYSRQCTVRNCIIKGHRAITNPQASSACTFVNSMQVNVSGNTCQATVSEGNGIGFASGSFVTITGNRILGYCFGIGVFTGVGISVTGNTCRGTAPVVVGRGLKAQSCYDVTFTGNTVEFYDTGIKLEDSRYTVTMGNLFANIGADATANAINNSNQAATAGEASTHLISGNTVRNCTGAGIYNDAGSDFVEITNNIIENVQKCGIQFTGNEVLVAGNLIKDWGLAYVATNFDFHAGVRMDDKGTVRANRFYNSVLTTVPAVALGNPANKEEICDNYSPTNNILYLSALTLSIELNGSSLGKPRPASPLVGLPWVGSVGGPLTTKAFNNNTSFTVTTYGEGKLFSIAAFGKAGLFFADNNAAAVVILSDPSSLFSDTAATPNKINVTRSGNVITVENKTGANASGASISFIGTRVLSATNPA